MPGRLIPLVTNEIYHVFNRGIDKRPTFTTKSEYRRATNSMLYYRYSQPGKRFAYFIKLSAEEQIKFLKELSSHSQYVDILAYCFMPNHFHFLVKQQTDLGISKFMSLFQNSYTRYFNTKHDRVGSLFLNQFKAVRIETDEQLLHVSRYIHLNPLTSYVVKDFDSLKSFTWSSFPEYLKKSSNILNTEMILNFFKGNKYEEFVQNQVEYQRELDKIKHLVLEEERGSRSSFKYKYK